MKIYLVRHTEYENPEGIYPFHLPVWLSEKGREDAGKIGKWLVEDGAKGLPIVSSPIVRCVQTAEIIASHIKSMVSMDERLIETSCPNVQGVKKPEKDAWLFEQEDESRESKKSILKRVQSIFDEKMKAGKDCILVSHGDPITLFYYQLIGKKIPKYVWSPENRSTIVERGEVVKIEIVPASSRGSSMQGIGSDVVKMEKISLLEK